jgi:hypothetical protein
MKKIEKIYYHLQYVFMFMSITTLLYGLLFAMRIIKSVF